MRGWAYTQFYNVFRVYEVESPAVNWKMYGDREPQDYHDAVFYRVGDTSQGRTLERRQLHETEKEAILYARRQLDTSVRSIRSHIKVYHEELKLKKQRLADLDAQAAAVVG